MELFRFVLVKPAEKVNEVIKVTRGINLPKSSLIQRGIPDVSELDHHIEIAEVDKILPTVLNKSPAGIRNAVVAVFRPETDFSSLVESEGWQKDKSLLSYGLVRIFNQGHDLDSLGPKLERFRQLYDLVEQVATQIQERPEKERYVLKPLQIQHGVVRSDTNEEDTGPGEPPAADRHIPKIRDLSAALKFLNSEKAFDEMEDLGTKSWPQDQNVLRLKPTWIERLPANVQITLKSMLDEITLVDFVQVHQRIRQLITYQNIGHQLECNEDVFRSGLFTVGQGSIRLVSDWPRTAQPSNPNIAPATGPALVLPDQKPSVIRPSGTGKLIVVRSHLKGYEGGEIGHIHNVLKSEHLIRETKRLERTETTETTSEANEKEDEKDTQSTERFALHREVSNVLKSDSNTKFGVSTSAKYGPTVEVKADISHAETNSSESSEKVASQFSKEVVSRAASKVLEKTFHSTVATQIQQFEENYRHDFDNKKGTENISGLYQWVNKVTQSQMFEYSSPRLLFDVIIPEPAQFLMELVSKQPPAVAAPPVLDFSARDINEQNYMELVARFGASGVKAPPPLRSSFSKGISVDANNTAMPGKASGILEVEIPKGQLAIGISGGCSLVHVQESAGQSHFELIFQASGQSLEGSTPVIGTPAQLFSFPPLKDVLAVGYSVDFTATFTVVVRVETVRDPSAFEDWQLTCYSAIQTAHTVLQSNYDRTIAQATIADTTMVSGDNPRENLRIIRTELKKSVISMLTQQSFSVFNAIDPEPATGSTKINVPAALFQGPYIAFFEQAFEWEQLQWVFYPYYWSRQSTWSKRALFENPDPVFADFARAGAARVNFGARPGFEKDVTFFLQTGKIWGGGPIPGLNTKDYLPISEEIANAEGRKGKEKAVGLPWEVSIPTSLVRLRKGSILPEFESFQDQVTQDIKWKETDKTAAQA